MPMKRYKPEQIVTLLRQIELEYHAAQRALTGPALGAAQHAFITARSEHIAQYHEQLVGQVGEQEGEEPEATDCLREGDGGAGQIRRRLEAERQHRRCHSD